MSSQEKGWKIENSLKRNRAILFVKWLLSRCRTLFCTFYQGIIRHFCNHPTLSGSSLWMEWPIHTEEVLFQQFLLNIEEWEEFSLSWSSVLFHRWSLLFHLCHVRVFWNWRVSPKMKDHLLRVCPPCQARCSHLCYFICSYVGWGRLFFFPLICNEVYRGSSVPMKITMWKLMTKNSNETK